MHLTGDKVIALERPISANRDHNREGVPRPLIRSASAASRSRLRGASTTPSRQALRELFTARKGKTQTQLVVTVVQAKNCNCSGLTHRPPSSCLPSKLNVSSSQSWRNPTSWLPPNASQDSRKASNAPESLGSPTADSSRFHHIMSNVPKRTDWAELGKRASPCWATAARNWLKRSDSAQNPGLMARCFFQSAITLREPSPSSWTTPSSSTPRLQRFPAFARGVRTRSSLAPGTSVARRTSPKIRSAFIRAATELGLDQRGKQRPSSRSIYRPSTRNTRRCFR